MLRLSESAEPWSAEAVLWDTADPTRPVRSATLTEEIASTGDFLFSPDGRTLVSNLGSGREVWDLTDRTHPAPLPVLEVDYGRPEAVFSPHDSVLAVETDLGTIVLVDLTDPARPQTIATLWNDGLVNSIAFSPDGQTLSLSE